NGKAVMTGSDDHTARLWDAVSGKPLGPPLPHQAQVRAVSFTPDGARVVTGSDDGFGRIWPGPAPLPVPLTDSTESIDLWIQVLTGLRLNDQGGLHVLDAATWQQLRQQLEDMGLPSRS